MVIRKSLSKCHSGQTPQQPLAQQHLLNQQQAELKSRLEKGVRSIFWC